MPDFRISELRHFWCDDAYKAKYGLPYCWSHGKDEKLLKGIIDWCDSAFGHEACVNKMKDGMRAYLRSNDGFTTKDNHPFSLFASSPHKYFVQEKPIEEQVRRIPCLFCDNYGIIYYEGKHYRCSCGWGYDFRKNFLEAPAEAFLPKKLDEEEVAMRVAKDPMNYLRGFIRYHKTIQSCAATLHDRMAKVIKEVCGIPAVMEEFKKQKELVKRL